MTTQLRSLREVIGQGSVVYMDPVSSGVINYDGTWFRYWKRIDINQYEYKAEVKRTEFGTLGHVPSELALAAGNWMINLRRTGIT